MKYHKKAIEILKDETINYMEIGYYTAKRYPSVIVKCNGRIDWREECKMLLKQGRKIQAIKLCKENTYLGLQDAKHAVEELEGQI